MYYLKLEGENTPIQSPTDGFGELYSTVNQSEFCPWNSWKIFLSQSKINLDISFLSIFNLLTVGSKRKEETLSNRSFSKHENDTGSSNIQLHDH